MNDLILRRDKYDEEDLILWTLKKVKVKWKIIRNLWFLPNELNYKKEDRDFSKSNNTTKIESIKTEEMIEIQILLK